MIRSHIDRNSDLTIRLHHRAVRDCHQRLRRPASGDKTRRVQGFQENPVSAACPATRHSAWRRWASHVFTARLIVRIALPGRDPRRQRPLLRQNTSRHVQTHKVSSFRFPRQNRKADAYSSTCALLDPTTRPTWTLYEVDPCCTSMTAITDSTYQARCRRPRFVFGDSWRHRVAAARGAPDSMVCQAASSRAATSAKSNPVAQRSA